MAEGGLGALGLDARALVFQVVNFAILLWALKRFALRPILNILEERRLKIAESLRSAHAIEQARTALQQEQRQLRRQAHEQAAKIVTASRRQAKDIVAAAETDARDKAAAVLAQAVSQIEQDTHAVRQQLKRETLSLVAAATEKLIGEKIHPAKDELLIRKALREAL